MASGVTSVQVQLDNFRKLRVSWVISHLLSHIFAREYFWIRICDMNNNRKNGCEMMTVIYLCLQLSCFSWVTKSHVSDFIPIFALVFWAWRSLPKLNDIKGLDDV